MCGIFGSINSGSVNTEKFEESVKMLRHRGPDDLKTRYWDDVAFGFVRLSIQDLTEAGHQPMSHPSKPVHIVFNGEIYNYKILREELKKNGASFFSESDTEVILHGYEQWGWDETLKRLEGMFALALFDEQKRIVYLARDRFGQKPLFYAKHKNQGLLFASECKAILNYTDHRRLDFLASLNPLFTTGLSPRGKTMFDGIEQVDEGSYLKYDLADQAFVQKKYFRVSDWVSESLYKEMNGAGAEEVFQRYENALSDSVQKHLLSDAPLASLFSAGLDSSLITSVAAKHRPIDLYYFESELQEDMKYPRFFADQYQLKLRVQKGNDHEYIFDLPRMIYHYETINKEDGLPLAGLCRFARRDGIKVLLTGDASDELFGGQPHFINFMIRNSFYQSKTVQLLMKVINKVIPFNLTRYTAENPLGTDYLISPTGNHFNEVPLNCLYHQGERLEEWQHCINAYSFVKDKREQQLLGYMLDEMAYRFQRYMIRSDRFGMMESVEIRTSFLDPGVVTLAMNTPSQWRMKKKSLGRGFEKKHIIRQLALRQGLPSHYVNRKKRGTPHNGTPQIIKVLKSWPLNHLSEFLRVSPETLKKISLGSYDADLSRIQFAFVSFEILARLFIDNEPYQNIEEEFRKIIFESQIGNEKEYAAAIAL